MGARSWFCVPPCSRVLIVSAAAGTMGGGGEVWLVPNAATWGYYHGAGVRPDYPLSLTTNGGQTCVTECTGLEGGALYITPHLFTGTQI